MSVPSGTGAPFELRGAELAHVFGIGAETRVRLRNHSKGPAVEVQVIDVERAELRLERRKNIFDRHIQHLRLRSVDIGIELRRVRAIATEETNEAGLFGRGGNDLLRGLLKLLIAAPAPILDHHPKAADVSHAHGTGGGGKTSTKAPSIPESFFRRSARICFELRPCRTRSSKGARHGKIVALFGAFVLVAPSNPTNAGTFRDSRHLRGQATNLPHDPVGARQRGAFRKLRDDDEVALVLRGE